ncbi:Ig-like domain-containing protein, partial [Chitinophaga sancti]
PDGSFTYTPDANYNGADSIKYNVCDNGTPSKCDIGTVTFIVSPVNDAPIAVDDAATLAEGTSANGNVLTNDYDVDGDALTASLLTPAVNGTATLDGNGHFTYTPNPNFSGKDSIVYQTCDNGTPGLCNTAVVIFTVTAINHKPIAVDDAITSLEDETYSGNVLTNDSDPDGDEISASIITLPVHGTASLTAEGIIVYTPDPNFNGKDSLVYMICDNGTPGLCDAAVVRFTVTPVNDVPVITGGDKTTTEQGKPVKDTLTATDPDGDPLTYSKGSEPAHGSVNVDDKGTYTYTPDPGFTGDDTFTVIVDDGSGNPKTVTVTVTVTPPTTTNHPPVVNGGYDITTEQDKPVKDTLTATDPDGDPLTFDKGSKPAHGDVVVDKDGTYTYTPDPGYTGTDTFTIIVDDGHGDPKTVTVTVDVKAPTTTNNPPVVTGGTTTTTEQDKPVKDTLTATDPEGGPLTYEKGSDPTHGSVKVDDDGTYTYTPDPGYTGDDTFTIIVKDDKGNTTAVTVTVTVTTPNKAPVVTGGTTTTTEQDKPVKDTLTATDPEGGPLTYEKGSDPTHGSVKVDDDGTYTYTPDPGYTGDDAFTIIVKDDKGNTTTVTVAVKVTIPDNSNNPLAFNDSITVVANTPIDIDVLANDSARTSTFDPGSVRVVDQPAHGSVVVNSNGTVTYTPATGYTGEDTFTYQVTTADGKTTNIATVKISTSFAEITVPTLFTPNGDGRNDVFEIRGLSQYAETELIIVNRWGNEVFRSKNYQNTWKGEGLNEGTYYYLLRIRRTASSGWEVIKGYTTLVRNFNN